MSIHLMRGFPEYLAGRGWDVHVVSSPGSLLDELDESPGVTAHRIKMARRPAPLADLLALCLWILLLLRIRPSITSVGTPKAGLLGGVAAWITRVPSRIYLLRGLPLETSTGIKFKLLGILERLSFATAHKALSVSPSLSARAVELGLVPKQKIRVLGAGSSNGVDLLHFTPNAPKLNEHDTNDSVILARALKLNVHVPVIGFVGRLTEDKGLLHLASARNILHSRGIDHQLLIVGGVDDAAAPESLKQLSRPGRPPIQTGHVVDTAPYYRLMDVLCLPTRREGFPNVVLEAAASGVPTVTTDATGAIDSVEDGVTGFVTRKESAVALADGLAVLLGDSQRRIKMGEAARLRAQNQYRKALVWGNLEEFYLQSLPENGNMCRQTLRRGEH